MRNQDAKHPRRRRQRGRKRIVVNEYKLIGLYLEGLSVRAIAAELGLSRSVIHRRLQTWRGFPHSQLNAAPDDQDFQEFDAD